MIKMRPAQQFLNYKFMSNPQVLNIARFMSGLVKYFLLIYKRKKSSRSNLLLKLNLYLVYKGCARDFVCCFCFLILSQNLCQLKLMQAKIPFLTQTHFCGSVCIESHVCLYHYFFPAGLLTGAQNVRCKHRALHIFCCFWANKSRKSQKSGYPVFETKNCNPTKL